MTQVQADRHEHAKDCTLACVKSGAKFVLYDAAAKTAYDTR